MLWGRSVTWVFVVVWLGVGVTLLVLDWLGNPSRGPFRPSKEGKPLPFRNGRVLWRRRRAERDAAVRTTLRERYGRSSLRILWTRDREVRAVEADAGWITDPLRVTDPVPAEEQLLPYESLLLDAQFAPTDPVTRPEEVDSSKPKGWRVGRDPFIPTRAGLSASKATIRARIWKNMAAGHHWECENGQRIRAGKPPIRMNAKSGKPETARIDLALGLPYWPGESTAQFDRQSIVQHR